MQVVHQVPQNSSTTTFPFSPSNFSGFEFSPLVVTRSGAFLPIILSRADRASFRSRRGDSSALRERAIPQKSHRQSMDRIRFVYFDPSGFASRKKSVRRGQGDFNLYPFCEYAKDGFGRGSSFDGTMTCSHVNFAMNRREFFGRFGLGLGGTALFGLLNRDAFGAATSLANPFRGILDAPHFPPKAKRIIYLFMSGGPSQHDLFDYKPLLNKMNGQDLPATVRMGQRLTGMSANQATLPLGGSIFKFNQQGQNGHWLSELRPQTAKMADELCFIRSMHTEAINHDPAITFFQTGSQLAGRPSIGSWAPHGLGDVNAAP